MFNKKTAIVICFLSVIFAFLLDAFTNSAFIRFSLKLSNVRDNVDIVLPFQDTYLLSIWNPQLPGAVYFNNKQLSASRISKRKDYTSYFVLSGNEIRQGTNNLKILGPAMFSLKIRNYIAASKFNNIFVLLKSSRFIADKKFSSQRLLVYALYIFLFLTFTWLIISSLGADIFLSYWLSFIPAILFYLIIILIEFITSYEILFSKTTFIGLTFFLVGIVAGPVVFTNFSRKIKKWFSEGDSRHFIKVDNLNTKELGTRSVITKLMVIILIYILQDSSNAYIISFMFLLFLSFLLLVFKIDVMAELLINIGFVVLLIGVGIKSFRQIVGHKRKKA